MATEVIGAFCILPNTMPDQFPEFVPQVGEYCRREVPVEVRRNRTKGADSENRTTVTINTADQDRHGTIIMPEGGDLANYSANPVVLINHDSRLLAANSSVSLQNGRLVANVEDESWDLEDPEIAKWFRKLKKGLLKMASIGFRANKVEKELIDPEGDPWDHKNIIWRITEWELLEWSFVTVPSNPNAVVTQRMLAQQGHAPVHPELTQPAAEQPEPESREAQEPADDAEPELRSVEDDATPEVDEAPHHPAEPPATRTVVIHRSATQSELKQAAEAFRPVIRNEIKRALGRC